MTDHPNNPTNVPLLNRPSQQPLVPTVQIPHPLLTTTASTCEDSPPTSDKLPPPPTMATSSSGKHPLYRGIRYRSGKWVSEIRSEAAINFPAFVTSYPHPASASSADIRKAAASAAALLKKEETRSEIDIRTVDDHEAKNEEMRKEEYVDEDALLNLPNLLVDMAQGMLVSPPRISSTPSDDSPENSDGESLWSY
ncbi:hypothetical protein V6N12_037829 [Hibiscus sabdariffa]|uniref:AP2/ERF domain-containing protein n=1 Tax=Hibiscus sabdariffa TaxID=183260 RepID=A0ABR2B212_9ROSI